MTLIILLILFFIWIYENGKTIFIPNGSLFWDVVFLDTYLKYSLLTIWMKF